MTSKTCMNAMCGASSSSSSIEWRKGWTLRSGESANLCDKCGCAYEQSIFCELFHCKESGWRECTSCGKRLHCGCIAAKVSLELLDSGGVKCISCAKNLVPHSIASDEKPNDIGMTTVDNDGEFQTTPFDNQTDGSSINKMELIQCISDGIGFKHLLHSQNGDTNGSVGHLKQEEVTPPSRETETKSVSDSNKPSTGSSQTTKLDAFRTTLGLKHTYESLAHTNLSIILGAPSGNLNPFPIAAVDEREQSKTPSSYHQGPRSRQLLPNPRKSVLAAGLETSGEIIPQLRVARPPAEGRGRNNLLPRYWPRITDQELQQISGDSNCIIVPLFEKILSSSDAGRIGRLVLPKACAEAYFPPISQPEGLPLKIQDVKGKEWLFQFRFWPNNNSRMYVLEGVTPCIQSMQLQAGDTVTFSRMDPEGKLVMGFRKASNSVAMQSLKGTADPHINALSKHLVSACEDSRWHNTEKHGGTTIESLMLQSMLVPEWKSTRNIGSKSKRLLIDSQDALELKLTWEEVQDMLQPPPSVRASVITIEDHEFEEYEEPPVFGKRSVFVIRTSGQEQWVQCDNCSKWRRLPVDVLLPSRWTCTENSWDPNRCSCSARDELTPRELENLLRQNKDFKKRKMSTSHHRSILEHESSGLDALANAAVLGDDSGTSVATTTKHPRHRPGCSCIVCIQPPSGKGKHKPTCTCNVCMTVKRRFKTLMMRKKKRQSEREAEISQRNHLMRNPNDEAEVYSMSRHVMLHLDPSDDDSRLVNIESESKNESNFSSNKLAETTQGHIDLNSHPDRGEDMQVGLARVSMTSLLQFASLPLETYLKQNGLTSLILEQQTSSGSHMLTQTTGESEGRLNDRCLASEPAVHEQDDGNDEHH